MATNTAGTKARDLGIQAVHYIRKGITFNDAGTTVDVGILPAGALILYAMSGVTVTTAFNGNATNTADIGVSGTLEKYASDLALGTVGFVVMDVSAPVLVLAADTTIQSVVVSTASPTTGVAEIVICYVPDNDL